MLGKCAPICHHALIFIYFKPWNRIHSKYSELYCFDCILKRSLILKFKTKIKIGAHFRSQNTRSFPIAYFILGSFYFFYLVILLNLTKWNTLYFLRFLSFFKIKEIFWNELLTYWIIYIRNKTKFRQIWKPIFTYLKRISSKLLRPCVFSNRRLILKIWVLQFSINWQ